MRVILVLLCLCLAGCADDDQHLTGSYRDAEPWATPLPPATSPVLGQSLGALYDAGDAAYNHPESAGGTSTPLPTPPVPNWQLSDSTR